MNCLNTQNRKSQLTHERIKPPPDLLSGHMKRIKIESKSPDLMKDFNFVNINKRKMSIDAVSILCKNVY